MRITQRMMSQDFLRQLNNSGSKLADLQEQLSTGKKITRPSQDPVVASLGIAYRTDVVHNDQFTRNMDEVHNWMDNSDSALDEATSVLQRIRELTIEASNDTYTDDQRQSVQKEVTQLKEQLVTIANTRVAGKYIFNGTQTSNAPITLDKSTVPSTVTMNYGTPGDVKIEVNDGIKLAVNVDPSKAFPKELFDTLTNIDNDLLTPGIKGKDIANNLDDLDKYTSQLVGERSELGARENRTELIENRLGMQKQTAEKVMATNEDADFEKVLIDFQTQESVHRAALAVGSRIIQPTLVDFLR